jgi:hypothetical protein
MREIFLQGYILSSGWDALSLIIVATTTLVAYLKELGSCNYLSSNTLACIDIGSLAFQNRMKAFGHLLPPLACTCFPPLEQFINKLISSLRT